ncbi:MAG: hypothetical protein JWM14_2035 [Chitinophagaceae bacterium]|nr:hypothetical protein [Chitinophagaceae bacterium]
MNKRYSYYLFILCTGLFLQVTRANGAANCAGSDVTFTSVTLTGVGNGMITYDVTIKNAGTQTLTFNKLTLAGYTSTDNTFDGSDVSGGSALFTAFASGTSVLAGQVYTTSYHANYTGDIKTLPYLILQLSYQDAECDATNNQIVVCTKPNPVLNDVAISYLDATSGLYNAAIQNTGGDTMFLSKSVIQNYVSTDNTLGGGDAAAGGSILSFGAKQYLLANESYVIYDFSFNATNMSSYSYVLATLYYTTATTCGTGNQVAKELVVTVTATEDAQNASGNAVVWDMNSSSFVTKDQIVWSGSINYQLFDSSGRLLIKGKTIPGERVYVPEGSGLAILTVTDEQHVYSQKIMR